MIHGGVISRSNCVDMVQVGPRAAEVHHRGGVVLAIRAKLQHDLALAPLVLGLVPADAHAFRPVVLYHEQRLQEAALASCGRERQVRDASFTERTTRQLRT
eukprot:scaffold3356_cov264-Pinguiococcus_pyrenoidosus.AAC.8